MGIDAAGLRFLLTAGGVDFSRTLTIGRQQLFLERDELEAAFRDHGRPLRPEQSAELLAGDRWSEPLLAHLGAGSVESLDASDYEGASIVHDLNLPLDGSRDGAFSCVFDGGSLEHVFEYTTALRSCMRMVAAGGHLISISPFDHYAGHGFYQLGPDLPFRAFTARSGYELERVLLSDGATWWELADPAAVGARAELPRRKPTLLYVQARRTELIEPLAEPPQESDYAAVWTGSRTFSEPPRPRLRDRLLRREPEDDPRFLRRVRL